MHVCINDDNLCMYTYICIHQDNPKMHARCRENDRLAADLERERTRMEEKGDRDAHARALREARRNLTDLENELANERDEARQEQAELRRQIVILQKQVRM
jgi:hypothetical protein